jgi:hypothetical protein
MRKARIFLSEENKANADKKMRDFLEGERNAYFFST